MKARQKGKQDKKFRNILSSYLKPTLFPVKEWKIMKTFSNWEDLVGTEK